MSIMNRTITLRKSPGRETSRSKRYLPNFVPCIDNKTKNDIIYAWDFLGTPPREIALNLRLTVIQVEAVIHEKCRTQFPIDPVTPSVRQSRQLHVVAMRRAA